MLESQVHDLLGKGLPKIASASFNALYPVGFQAALEPAHDYEVEGQVVASQLIYSRNYQVYSFVVMDVSLILKLGLRAFPKYGRSEIPKLVISANGEALNTITSKLAFLVGKVDEDATVATTPPIVLNCSGPNRISLRGSECHFLKLTATDLSMLVIAVVQQL